MKTMPKDQKTRFEQAAEAGDFAEAVCLFVGAFGGVSYIELQDRLTPYMETKGEVAQGLDDLNVFFWTGMSEGFVEAVGQAVRAGRIHAEPTTPLVYWIDGGALGLPLAKRPPKGGYKEPHWLPVVLNPGPPPARGTI